MPNDDDLIRRRMRQRDLLADIGTAALRGTDLQSLLHETCRLVAEGLDVQFCKVLELLASEQRLLVRAGVGWPDGIVGRVKLEADDGSAAGHALRTDKPVISNDLAEETRFRTPQILVEQGIQRAMNVIICVDGKPWGVLEADTRDNAPFSEFDISFMRASANLLGVAIERAHREGELRQEVERREILAREADHRIKNSLQLVASLLTLQRSQLHYDPAVKALDEAIACVIAVAESHSALQMSTDLRTVTLAQMLTNICERVGRLNKSVAIGCSCDEQLELDAERAIPLGLIISELLTNAFRHAYPDGRSGMIRLRAVTTREFIEITVSDDGIGMREDVTGHEGLGTAIVKALVRQIKAELNLSSSRGRGTQATLRLRKEAGPE